MSTEVFFSNNPADWEKLEGLYISEQKPPGAIQGRDLFQVGLGGTTVRGPTTVQKITNPDRWLEIYGGRSYVSGGAMQGQGWMAMQNKKFGTIHFRRIVAADAVLGTVNLLATATPIVRADAGSKGAWSLAANSGPTVSVEAATNGQATQFNARIKYQGREILLENLNTQAGQDNLDEVQGDDPAMLVKLVKVADGRPDNVSNAALATGSNGTLVSADYIAALTDLAAVAGPALVAIADASVDQAALNAQVVTKAGTAVDRLFITWSGTHGQTVAQDVTAIGTQITTRSDRIVWCYNSPWTVDPESGVKVQTPAHLWMLSILSQTDVDIHPGEYDTAPLLSGISTLSNEALSRDDLILLKQAGICAIEKLDGAFLFKSGVTTSLQPGLTEISRRRSADFLQLSAADYLKFMVKKKATQTRRTLIRELLSEFSQGLQDDERIIDEDDADLGPGFSVIEKTTDADRKKSLYKYLWMVRFMGHILHLVVETQFGVGLTVTIKEAA